MTPRLLALSGMLLILVAACGRSSLAIANRSVVDLAVGPGVTVPACGTLLTSIAEYGAAQSEGAERSFEDESWIPDGAMPLQYGILAAGTGPPVMITLIVSSISDPKIVMASVPAADLPSCEGRPRVGEAPTVVP